jgi:hypothetical protein
LSRHFSVEDVSLRSRFLFDDDCEVEQLGDPAMDVSAALATRVTSIQPCVSSIENAVPIVRFDRPIFVLAAPRAGGTLLARLLAVSRQLWTISDGAGHVIDGMVGVHPATGGWESHRLTDLNLASTSTQALEAALTVELHDAAGRRFVDLPPQLRPSSVRFIERTSENALRALFLAAVFRDAYFVLVHRDARQNVSSLLASWRDDGSVTIPSLPGWRRGAWHGLLPEHWRDYIDAPLVDVSAFQWASANQCALDDLEWLPRDRWMVVDHAELVASPRSVIERVLSLADLVMDDALRSALERPYPFDGVPPPSPIKWRSNPEFRESAVAPHNVLRGRLREYGGECARPPARSLDIPTIRFGCFLDQVCIEPAALDGGLIVHPSFRLQLGETPPLGLAHRTRFRGRFVRDYPLIWVEDGATRVLYPFWVRRTLIPLLMRFAPNQPPPPVPPELAAQLLATGVLVSPSKLAARAEEGEARAQAARAELSRARYTVLPSVLSADHVDALARYYDALIDTGSWVFGDTQVSQRYGCHNEPLTRFFHYQLADYVGRVGGEPIRPSYCYVSAYRGGRASLRPHVDRKQCVYTMSLWIRGRDSAAVEPWPLWLHSPDGIVSVTQSAADGVLFRGCELPHWRDQPPPGGACTALIFHYVPHDFSGVLD